MHNAYACFYLFPYDSHRNLFQKSEHFWKVFSKNFEFGTFVRFLDPLATLTKTKQKKMNTSTLNSSEFNLFNLNLYCNYNMRVGSSSLSKKRSNYRQIKLF